MLAYMTYDLSTVFLLLVLAFASWTDIRRHRIANVLTFSMLGIGLTLQFWFLSLDGLWTGLQGMGVGLVVLLPFFLLGGMGAGDVKLMAAVGSIIGPIPALLAACLSLVAAGLFSFVLLLRHRDLGRMLRRYAVVLATRQYLPPEADEVANKRFPYAAAIAVGTIITLGWNSQLEFYHLGRQLSYYLHGLGAEL